MKKIISVFALLAIFSCGGSQSSANGALSKAAVNLTKKVLASNVIMTAEASTIDPDVDTEMKVLASNVVVDNTNVNVTSDNVQAALAEIQPTLAETIVGTWTIQSTGMTDVWHGASPENLPNATPDLATIEFKSDGTLVLSNVDPDSNTPFLEYTEEIDLIKTEKVTSYIVPNDMVVILRYHGFKQDLQFMGHDFPLVLARSDQNTMILTMSGYPLIFTRVVE